MIVMCNHENKVYRKQTGDEKRIWDCECGQTGVEYGGLETKKPEQKKTESIKKPKGKK
jgi:hypothetical protein